MQLLTERHVGKAMPFFNSFSFLKTFTVSSISSLSPMVQSSRTEAPATHLAITA